MRQIHPIPPLFNAESKILILGSFPSVKSREEGFFYGHPQNRFWRVLAAVFKEKEPETVPQKREILLRNGVALWDVIASCEIIGSADSSIKNIMPNPIHEILNVAPIRQIYTNGKTAEKLYIQHLEPKVNRKAIYLPSTSPANAAWSLEKLIEHWRKIAIE
ncbi:MAG: DNA-deoxyinosine glycosylase [Clostridia bacterium]|nr:DNA-deoxyinosine glycosylase [Clostridia bacterium]